jgi:hypothetical protein
MGATLVGAIRGIFAACKCSTTDDVTSFDINRGFASVSRTSAGKYLLTLQDGVNLSAEASCIVQTYGTAADFTHGLTAGILQVESTSLNPDNLEFSVTIGTGAGVATDADFCVLIQDVSPN